MPHGGSTPARLRLWVDLPAPESATAGALKISGWAFSLGGARIVEIRAQLGSRSTVIPQGVHRPDVALALAEPQADWCGFEATLAIEEAEIERADLLLVCATDELGESAEVELPVRILPSGRPAIGIERARCSDDRVDVEGWLVWPDSDAPRAVELFFGAQRIAESTPNLSRPDVASQLAAFPSGSCRGFRLSAWLDPLVVPAGESVELRVVCTDARGRQLQQSALVSREFPHGRSEQNRLALLQVENGVAQARERTADEPVVLDWNSGLQLAAHFPALTVFQVPAAAEAALPYLDRSIDIVVTDGIDAQRIAEARRVAAVVTVEGAEIRWQSAAPARFALPTATLIISADCRAIDADSCFTQLKETVPADFRGEIFVVDDPSSHEFSAKLQRCREAWPLLEFLPSDGEVGLVRRCNRAADLARGEVLVFVGKMVLPRPGWLSPLLRLLQEDPSVGAVGGKLLSPQGRLRGAGGILFSDGSECELGRGDGYPDRPLYSFVRDVDFCSSALLAVRRATFLEMGGFDAQPAPAGDPGVQFCSRLRQLGHRVRYQPACVAVIAAVLASSAGSGVELKRVPVATREVPQARWWKVPARQPRPPAPPDLSASHPLSSPTGVRRVLICAPRMPEFDRESGSQRVFHLVELMQQAGWAVSYLAARSVHGERYLRLLQQRGVATYAGPDSLRAGDEYLDDVSELIADGGFDLAILAFWTVAETLLPTFRKLSPATRLLVDSIDLHYLREERAASSSSPGPESAANVSRRLDRKSRELNTYAAADAVLTVSIKEAEQVSEAISHAVPVFCVPDLEDLRHLRRGFRERSGLLFIGNFHHTPNFEGLEYLCTEILSRLDPALIATLPLSVVGNGVDDRVRATVAKVAHAKIVGWVPSVVPYLERALVSVVPLLHGAGTKRKLVQALMVGTPNVSTSIGVEGLNLEHGRHVLVADSAEEFAAGIRRLATDPMLWNRLAREGRRQIERAHGRGVVQRSLLSMVDSVMRSAARGRPTQLSAG